MALAENHGPDYGLDIPSEQSTHLKFREVGVRIGNVVGRFSVILDDGEAETVVLEHLKSFTEHIRTDTSAPRQTKQEMYGFPDEDIHIIPAVPKTPDAVQRLEMEVAEPGIRSVSIKELTIEN